MNEQTTEPKATLTSVLNPKTPRTSGSSTPLLKNSPPVKKPEKQPSEKVTLLQPDGRALELLAPAKSTSPPPPPTVKISETDIIIEKFAQWVKGRKFPQLMQPFRMQLSNAAIGTWGQMSREQQADLEKKVMAMLTDRAWLTEQIKRTLNIPGRSWHVLNVFRALTLRAGFAAIVN